MKPPLPGDAPQDLRQQVCSPGVFTALTCHRRGQPSATVTGSWSCAEATKETGLPSSQLQQLQLRCLVPPPIPHPLASLQLVGEALRVPLPVLATAGSTTVTAGPVLPPTLLPGSLRPSPAAVQLRKSCQGDVCAAAQGAPSAPPLDGALALHFRAQDGSAGAAALLTKARAARTVEGPGPGRARGTAPYLL